jgi:transcriptional regulator with XRE-family HTH domain
MRPGARCAIWCTKEPTVAGLWSVRGVWCTGRRRGPASFAGCCAQRTNHLSKPPIRAAAGRLKRQTQRRACGHSSTAVIAGEGRSARLPHVATRQRPLDRARDRAAESIRRAGHDIRLARVSSGLSLRVLGNATEMSYSEIARIERGLVPEVPAIRLFELGALVGLDASLRMFVGGDAVRDAGQLGLLDRLRKRLPAGLRWQSEVPLPVPGDRRAWDAQIRGEGWSIVVEGEMQLTDLHAIERRIALKARDADVDHVLLLVADTRRNRHALKAGRESLRGRFPLDGRELLRAIEAGRDPGAGGIVIL